MADEGPQNFNIDLGDLKKKIFVRVALLLVVFGLILFLPSGTLSYWEAWVYLGVLFVPMIFVVSCFLKRDPGFLYRRMRMREKEAEQKILIKLGYLVFLGQYIIPGLDRRYGWSSVPLYAIIISDAAIFLGYMFIVRVFKENSYASRVIEVDKKQKTVTTGPYSLIRHPMYLGFLLMYLATPLALASYWAMVPASLMIPFIVVRIVYEERVLIANLEGYKEYTERTKYRLIPRIW